MAQRQRPAAVTFELHSTIDLFLEGYATTSPRTQQCYQDNVGRVLRQWFAERGVVDLFAVTPELMQRYMFDQVQCRLSPHTLAGRFSRALRFFNWCIEQNYLGEGENPMARLRRPRLPKRGRQAFTRDEIHRLLKVLAAKPGWIGLRDRALVTVLLGTGVRATELMGMRLSDIEWAQKRILVRGKGSKDRRVPMGKNTMGALRDYLRQRPRDSSPLIWLSQRGGPMNYGALEAMVRHLGEYAAVSPCHVHLFRHTFATEFYLANRDVIALKNRLGHDNVAVTMKYLDRLGVSYTGSDDMRSPDEWLS